MFTTLQKEYALIYYIRNVLGKPNNGFLHELYTEKNIKTILEALIKNKIKDQQTINVESVVKRVMRSIDISTLTNPRKENAKFNVLPYDPVSFMELYMGRTINNLLKDLTQRVFIDDITEAKDGIAVSFVSTFTIKDMINPNFIKLVTLDKRPDASEIEQAIHKRYPDANMFADAKDMSEIEESLKPFATQMARNHFTNKDLAALFKFIELNYGNNLNQISLTNGINAVVQNKKENIDEETFRPYRDQCEEDVKNMVMSTSSISDMLKRAAITRFAGTMKYTRNGTLEENEGPSNVIQITLSKQEQTVNGDNAKYDLFVSVLNNLLAAESLPTIKGGVYRSLNTVILTEEQYYALFPEYFVTVGSIKEKVSSESEMGGSTMKSGDETASVIDRYTGDDKADNEEDDEAFDSNAFTIGKTKKLMVAKMLATLNGHPENVPDTIEPKGNAKSMIQTLNRILVVELFDSSYGTLQGLVTFLTTGDLPNNLKDHIDELTELRDRFLAEHASERQGLSQRDIHVKAFATVLSELARLAKMDPQSELRYKEELSFNRTSNFTPNRNTTITSDGNTYILNNLSTIVNAMIEHAKEGQFIGSMTLASSDPVKCALGFLKDSGLLDEDNGVYRLETDSETIDTAINGMDWVSLPNNHYPMMSDALRNCSYIYKLNGWVRMNNDELRANKFTPIKDVKKKNEASDDTHRLVSMIEKLQYRIKPYVLKLKNIDLIINLLRKQYNLTSLNGVDEPVVNNGTLSAAEGMMQMFGTDQSAETLDKISLDYYINHVINLYEKQAEEACKVIKQTLAENHLLNEDVRNTLLSKVSDNERKKAIINEIFGVKKRETSGNLAEDIQRIEVRNIFTLSQYIINLYNKARNDVAAKNQSIASCFTARGYVKTSDLKEMANGNAPSRKMYTENGSGCPNEFMLNAYLIDILFEAVYLIAVQFDLPIQSKYTAQEANDLNDITEMKAYIKDNIGGIIVKDSTSYKQLLTAITTRLDILFETPMLNMVSAVIVNNPQVTQLTDAAYSKINAKNKHLTSQKVMSGVTAKHATDFDLEAKRNHEEELNKFWRRG